MNIYGKQKYKDNEETENMKNSNEDNETNANNINDSLHLNVFVDIEKIIYFTCGLLVFLLLSSFFLKSKNNSPNQKPQPQVIPVTPQIPQFQQSREYQ